MAVVVSRAAHRGPACATGAISAAGRLAWRGAAAMASSVRRAWRSPAGVYGSRRMTPAEAAEVVSVTRNREGGGSDGAGIPAVHVRYRRAGRAGPRAARLPGARGFAEAGVRADRDRLPRNGRGAFRQ